LSIYNILIVWSSIRYLLHATGLCCSCSCMSSDQGSTWRLQMSGDGRVHPYRRSYISQNLDGGVHGVPTKQLRQDHALSFRDSVIWISRPAGWIVP
jgi:hypothetical protein